MDPQQEFVRYLENNPQFYEISQSELYMQLLLVLEKRAHSMEELHEIFPDIEDKDMELIIGSLMAVKLVERTRISDTKIVYYISEAARGLLSHYKNARKHFDLG